MSDKTPHEIVGECLLFCLPVMPSSVAWIIAEGCQRTLVVICFVMHEQCMVWFKVSFNETHELGEQAAEGPVFKSKQGKEKRCIWQMPERAWL